MIKTMGEVSVTLSPRPGGAQHLFPSFTFNFSLGEQVSAVYKSRLARGSCPAQNSTGPSLCQKWLDLPEEGHPGSPGLPFFLGLNFPARSCVAKAARASTCPLPAAPQPQHQQWKGVSSQCPREGHGEGGGCMCVFVTVAKTLRYLAVRGCFRWVSRMGDKERKSRLSSSSGSSRGGGGRAGPHLLAGCRGNGRHRGPSSPRQSKQDRWAWAWRD